MSMNTEVGPPTGYREIEKSALCRKGEQEIRDALLAKGVSSEEDSNRRMREAILAAAAECRAFLEVVTGWRANPDPTPSRRSERRNVVALHFSRLHLCFKARGVSEDTAIKLAEIYQIKA